MIAILITLAIFGVVLYLVGLIPMDATIRRVIQVVAILLILLWLLKVLGVWSGAFRIPG